MQISIGTLVGALIMVTTPVRADVVTLECVFETGGGDRSTIDIDEMNQTVQVTIRGSGYLRTPVMNAQITDRYITWPNPNPVSRLDRRTGVLIDLRGIFAVQKCQRASSEDILHPRH